MIEDYLTKKTHQLYINLIKIHPQDLLNIFSNQDNLNRLVRILVSCLSHTVAICLNLLILSLREIFKLPHH